MEEEDPFRLNARRLGAVALVLYAVSILIAVLGIVVAVGIVLSALPPVTLPGVPITPEVIRVIAGLVLFCVGIIVFTVFSLYAGFKGRSVVSKVDLTGWDGLIKTLGKLYFVAMLFLAIGIFIIPGTTGIYGMTIILLIYSILIMVCALLVPSPQRSIAAGILLIIAAGLSMFGGRISIPGLGAQIPGISQLMSALFVAGTFPGVAFIVVGIALIVRQVILRWPISHLIASVGGLIFAIGIAYADFSIVSFMSGLPLPSGVTPAETAFWTLYSTSMVSGSLGGIAGILGIVALIFAIVFMVKTGFPALGMVKAPPTPVELPAKELRYCPSCGVPVSPGDIYCGNCGRKLR